ncbi:MULTISPECIES: bifunctional diguanylate cyclase/phosphodiesterase [unclassified Colwellia]|uniref:putative bifunctional diguanylate cyclase/phosphodiesterase n=1 Tax=unclassified Colwellia TaxID=196834 RepID=UPI0015F4A42D|nr:MULTISPECIES: EAL domain-containing protein [unclassified Colwellia]MBA6350579.1 EAL domain-containing protein [Colwellia sp. BRX9-1]MBA6355333.1 EAL domain-containing protein [Colwellia sp. BRX8-3]MBA6358679.1 EAL domain-containing protein [Colwellia sp. BRX8-6]MBA6367346.1 EAL domain-containing protein [Colwellia sp. BRX8-5]MBA6377280.1 EAL domain-containing protein [Colwellia sp. BRX8-2]
MRKRFVSVPVKLLVLVMGALLLLTAIFSYLSLSRLNQEFTQYQSDTLRKGQAQFSVQNNVLRQKILTWLESFSDIVRLKEQADFDVLAQEFAAQFDTLQMNQNVENVWLVSASNEELYLSNAIPKFVQLSIENVLRHQQPEHTLYCEGQCVQLITIPVLNGKGDMAVVAMTVSLVDMIFYINQALDNELAVVSFSRVDKLVSITGNEEAIILADAKFISSTNTQLVSELFMSNQEIINSEMINFQGIKATANDSSYLINLIPIANTRDDFYYLALIDDATIFTDKYQQNRWQFLIFTLVVLIALVIVVHFVASPFTRRLLVLSDVLPLLAKKEFDRFRQTDLQRNGKYIDELDILANAATELSFELEQLNIEIEQKTKELENIAMYDLLTGLPNRNMLNYQLRKAFLNVSRSDGQIAVLFLDLDDFKKVNDSHGHTDGDKLLIQAANRLRSSIRRVDMACRFGGDEFVVVLGHIDNENDAVLVAQEILEAFKEPIKIQNSLFYVSTSIGIAFAPEEMTKSEDLISYADIAMYEAKDDGGAKYHIYHEEMYKKVALRVMMESEVRQALAKNQFSLSLQPQLDAKTKKLYGFEALLRWQHPERGMVSPEDFIPLLENSQHMVELGYWVIRRCFELCQTFIDKGLTDVRIAINLSAGQFADPHLTPYLTDLLNEFSLEASHFELELTEQTLVKNIDSAIEMMNGLRDVGFSFAIDDFGTGYSSLAYLKKMPVDVIKIDKSFVFGMLENRADYQIIMSTIAMVKNLGLQVIAEGVETSAQLRSLTENDCDIIQGYYFSKPIPETKLMEFIDTKIVNGYWKVSAL